ncbi:hypothetical protein C8R46DRAFT_1348090 [Mycena filopes]|nr:hypothetical protein C8R46DRAFT_1348090 [Mycena filopes]
MEWPFASTMVVVDIKQTAWERVPNSAESCKGRLLFQDSVEAQGPMGGVGGVWELGGVIDVGRAQIWPPAGSPTLDLDGNVPSARPLYWVWWLPSSGAKGRVSISNYYMYECPATNVLPLVSEIFGRRQARTESSRRSLFWARADAAKRRTR